MEIRDNDNFCILAPLNPKLDLHQSNRLMNIISQETRNIAIDLSFVQDCTIDFIESLKDMAETKKIGIFNIPSDIFVLFNIMQIDKLVKLYVNESDFEKDIRQLINRQFSIV